MINPFHEIDWSPDEAAIAAYGRSMLIGFSVVAAVFFIIGTFRSSLEQAVATPLVIFLAGFFIYAVSRLGVDLCKPIYLVWHFLAACVGIVVANLALFLFFHLIFSPTAVLARWSTGRDPLALRKDPEKKTFWIESPPKKSLKSYFRLY